MKTAILVAVSEDGRTGRPLTGVLPYDQAARQLKSATDVPDGFAALEIYVKGGKRRKIKSVPTAADPPSTSEVASAPAAPSSRKRGGSSA